MSISELREAARPRCGVFTLSEAWRAGVSRKALRRMEGQGEIVRVHHDVWRFTVVAYSNLTPVFGALAGAGDRAVASHTSAMLVLGLSSSPAGTPEITLPLLVRPDLQGVRIHRSRDLPAEDIVEVGGVPCTAGPRTLVDMAGRQSVGERLDTLDLAICSRIASRPVVHRRALDLRSGRRGVGTLVEATRPGADGEFWSKLERRFGEQVKATDLPQPKFNVPVWYDGRRFVLDVIWEDQRLVVELQGLRFHYRPQDRLRDDNRHNILTHLGLRSLIFGWRDVTERFDDVVLPQLRRALGVGMRPVGLVGTHG